MESIENILSGKSPATTTEQAAPVETPVSETPTVTAEPTGETEVKTDDRPRDPATGKFVEKPRDAAPPAATKQEGSIPIQALLDEPEKRQKAERDLEEWRRRATPVEQPKRPDVFQDPDAAFNFERSQFAERDRLTRVEVSQEMMRMLKDDYDEMEKVFVEEAMRNPALAAQNANHPFPAKHAYETAKKLLATREIGDDPTAYREKLEKEIREKVLAELQQQPTTQTPQTSAFPTSLSSVRNAAPRNGPAWGGPTPLNQIIGQRR
jgi:hypothetical protein